MRGKVDGVRQYPADGGITPAYAGKSACLSRSTPTYTDHPRLCGEKLLLVVISAFHDGSPPPMRGKGR